MTNGYGSFAAFYDALTDDVDYAAWADYLLDYAVSNNHVKNTKPICKSSRNACVDNAVKVEAEAHSLSAESGKNLTYSAFCAHNVAAVDVTADKVDTAYGDGFRVTDLSLDPVYFYLHCGNNADCLFTILHHI